MRDHRRPKQAQALVTPRRKRRDQLDMGAEAKLVDGRDRVDPIAARDQGFCVARECRGVAGDIDDAFDFRTRELLRLRLRALARRIEDDGVEGRKLGREQGPAEKIARLRLERFEPLRVTGGFRQGRDRGGIGVEGPNLRGA